jgi:hypothetical protein
MALFGSRARGDHRADSDIDVLLWTDGGYPMVHKVGLLALAFYPKDLLLEKARNGDLFAGHLACEALPVWDPSDLLGELRSSYKPSDDQEGFIVKASELGAMLLQLREAFPPELLNKRMAWVVRTILIARAAQQGKRTFAAEELLKVLNAERYRRIIDRKQSVDLDWESIKLFDQFITERGQRNSSLVLSDLRAFQRYFEESGNSFGEKTARQLIEHLQLGDYS